MTNEINTWTEDHWTSSPIRSKMTETTITLANSCRDQLGETNLPVLPLLVALCSVSTHILHTGRGSFYWHCLNCIVTVQWLSTLSHEHRVLLIREGMHNRERELCTHEQCFSDAQHKNLIKIVPEWWCEKHPAKSVINIKFISYISTMYHLPFRSTLRIVGTQMNPQIRTDLHWNLTFLLASHSFKLQP